MSLHVASAQLRGQPDTPSFSLAGDHTPPGGESWNATAARVAMTVRRIEAAHPNAHIIAVAHFGVILTQVQAVLGLSAQAVLAHRIDPLSVTTLHPGTGTAETINHLP